MKQFDITDKKLPYEVSQEYISNLVEKDVELAISSSKKTPHLHGFRKAIILTAIAASFIGIGIFFSVNFDDSANATAERIAQSKSIDEVLGNMSDEQLAAVTTYYTDDIPEY